MQLSSNLENQIPSDQLPRSTNMHESSDSQSFTITIGIQSGLDNTVESRSISLQS